VQSIRSRWSSHSLRVQIASRMQRVAQQLWGPSNPDFLLGGRTSTSAECRVREGSPLVKLRNFALGKCSANRMLDCFAVLKSDVLMVRSSATDADPHQPAFEAHGAVHDWPGG
jgi:hypothetical protein